MSRTKTADGSIDIGISAAERKKISRGLSVLLADSYTLYLMTHNFHWNRSEERRVGKECA